MELRMTCLMLSKLQYAIFLTFIGTLYIVHLPVTISAKYWLTLYKVYLYFMSSKQLKIKNYLKKKMIIWTTWTLILLIVKFWQYFKTLSNLNFDLHECSNDTHGNDKIFLNKCAVQGISAWSILSIKLHNWSENNDNTLHGNKISNYGMLHY